MRRIGIYGGSFNPPHNGHILAAQEAISALELDRLLFVPAGTPPHKALPEGSPTAQCRMELLQLAAEGLERAEICDLECRKAGPSYSFETMEQLRAQYPEDALFLLMGTDMFLSLHTWRNPERICRCATIVLASRVENEGKIHAEIQAQAVRLRTQFGAEVQILDNRASGRKSCMVWRRISGICPLRRCGHGAWHCTRKSGWPMSLDAVRPLSSWPAAGAQTRRMRPAREFYMM